MESAEGRAAIIAGKVVAGNRWQVDAFHRAVLKAGAKDKGAPGLRPHYHTNYYAAFVIGPDEHNTEVVCHEPGS